MEYLSKGPEAQTYVQIKEHKINALALKGKKSQRKYRRKNLKRNFQI